MPSDQGSRRRDFLKTAALATGAAVPVAADPSPTQVEEQSANQTKSSPVEYPRRFTGRALSMISFPLGGVGAGSIGLGGRGQLLDWEIANRADKGNSPEYAFAAIWVKVGNREPFVRVLESRIQPPYEGQDGLGAQNAPGLSRITSATFIGEFPLCQIDFHDPALPLQVSLEAGTPFIPLDGDDSGLPVACLRYRIRNQGADQAVASVAFSIDNPIRPLNSKDDPRSENRANEVRQANGIKGVFMRNPGLAASDAGFGTFALAALDEQRGTISTLKGWPAARWWTSPLLFWDDFSADGELGPESEKSGPVGAVCIKRSIPAGSEATYTFLLSWHFPNRTPARCGWTAPKGHENDVIGNWYATKFSDAWAASEYAAGRLNNLQERTRKFAAAFRNSTLPSQVKEAASANLSTLVTQTCFRTADGEFHGFEGINDHVGCCHGNCTHVWNYEGTTANLFPAFSRSLRRAAFGYSMDDRGAMYFRQSLPDGIERVGFVAADGQMGQIIKVYQDWQLSGDGAYLSEFWPKAKKALEFCWVRGGWDANRDGVMEGVQHNTYDVEFYGPNPLCGIYYLGALRAAEEMAKASGDAAFAVECRRLFESGSKWIDANLFNGEYYIQKIRSIPSGDIAAGLRGGMGADDPEHPQYQLGNGCLVDQLLGQYLADMCGLGSLLEDAKIGTTLESIHRYNHKPNLFHHDSLARTFVLNDEAAMVVCDYGKGTRPQVPFPYYAEVFTGLEHATAALLIYRGMTDDGIQSIADIRRRYDGVRRNPWDEAECGHHYARAMAAWSSFVALSGFRYKGSEKYVAALPRWRAPNFQCFWSTGTGWGTFALTSSLFSLNVIEGQLPARTIEFTSPKVVANSSVKLGAQLLPHSAVSKQKNVIVNLQQDVTITPDQALTVQL